ncbi:hypothetical protein [Flavihumibacter fluvii]|uniref:hypothetical protein n=1 Tax=Flavihumibacter fluvii TaxID=2838157 RepID=UPI001BDF2FFE|nr:hypothetical protein [Flavihumibacter fluvii]ULQ50610.1 hypothetical protein KJS93_11010 [Flavihumibacter fluvii]
MKKIDPIWLHRIIRISGGLGFIAIATQFEGSWPLYIFGGIMLVTAFIRPKRCYGECEINTTISYADENKK